ncbi:hypothetical protein PCO31111_02724 [Pandoraea communis]|uniref:Uncharacterized protein n=1 Tax=Pandoraea communis TaxID=2508297 RepID=A0A5E4VMN3_9BURK|nr:hypothetical protein PCO31111_02724 [Pandoraea communis]
MLAAEIHELIVTNWRDKSRVFNRERLSGMGWRTA